jgi:hypothetical protein
MERGPDSLWHAAPTPSQPCLAISGQVFRFAITFSPLERAGRNRQHQAQAGMGKADWSSAGCFCRMLHRLPQDIHRFYFRIAPVLFGRTAVRGRWQKARLVRARNPFRSDSSKPRTCRASLVPKAPKAPKAPSRAVERLLSPGVFRVILLVDTPPSSRSPSLSLCCEDRALRALSLSRLLSPAALPLPRFASLYACGTQWD